MLISDAFGATLPGKLERFGEVTDDKSRASEAEVVLIRSKTKVTKEYIDGAPKLKLVIRGGVGLDNVDREYAKTKGIQVFNTADASTVAVAEVAFALMIGITNHVGRADSSMRAGKWLKKELGRTELMGKTVAVLGMGRIGSALGERAKAFGMKVIGYDPFVKSSDVAEMKTDLDAALGEADYVSMHMPLTDDTKGLINSERIAKFKDGAWLINTGRGKCIVEEDIVAALDSGKLSGYATDVWYSDPPDADCPLLKCEKTLLMPHLGASSKENMIRIGEICEKLIEEYSASR
jgi:D-3-phosphoglycerate dehydrogenase